jgi:hypothetical protein
MYPLHRLVFSGMVEGPLLAGPESSDTILEKR